MGYNRDYDNRRYGNSGRKARYYTCFTCRKSFTTSTPAPKCQGCGKVLKGTLKRN